jgi:lipopolysaccharide transport system permease protein
LRGVEQASSNLTAQRSAPALALPEEPLVIIEAGKRWAGLNLRDLWAYRELLYFLVWRDLKVRYRQTLIGAAWAVFQPLMLMIVFTLFLGILIRVPSDGIPYPLFAYTGILLWLFFASAVISGSGSLVGNANLITKVYFPRMVIPIAAVGARLVDLTIAAVIFVGLTVYYGVQITWGIFMLPVILALVVLLALGIGIWASAVNVKYRDVGVVLPVMIQLGMYASPVIYPLSLIPEQWRWLYSLNPLVGIITNFRAALFGSGFNWTTLGISALITLVVLVYAAHAFRRMEKSFADII